VQDVPAEIGTVGAEFIVAAKIIVMSTLASLFSTYTFFSDFFLTFIKFSQF
jgi:hypothetical protein